VEPAGRKYWTGFDVAANVAGYVPLGFLLGLEFPARGSQRSAHPTNTAAIRSRCWRRPRYRC
jgi:hypothetical protein